MEYGGQEKGGLLRWSKSSFRENDGAAGWSQRRFIFSFSSGFSHNIFGFFYGNGEFEGSGAGFLVFIETMLVEYRARESRRNSNDFHALKRGGGEGAYGHSLGRFRFGRGKQGTKILEWWMKAWELFGGCLRNSRQGSEERENKRGLV
jgi:hypothetical protein